MFLRAAVLMGAAATSAQAGPIAVDVTGGIEGTGQVLATLFRGEENWMKSPTAERTATIGASGSAHVDFGDHPPGDYGISIVYDEDMDGELDLNLIGIPSEAFGFSNNASALIGVPGWEKVRFTVGTDPVRLGIRLDRAD